MSHQMIVEGEDAVKVIKKDVETDLINYGLPEGYDKDYEDMIIDVGDEEDVFMQIPGH